MRDLSCATHAALIPRRHRERVSATNPRTARLSDPALPAVTVLLGDGVPPPLAAAMSAVGAEIEEARAVQVTWWPGSSITVRYRARLRGAYAGVRQLVATAGRIPEGAVVVGDGESQVGVWRVPHDPSLPGLAQAMDPEAVRRLLADLGAVDGPVQTRLRAYRPGRRAVVEARGEQASIFLKLVPPPQARTLHDTHTAAAAHLPVPRSLGYSAELGLVALETLPGITLRAALADPAAPLPPPQEVIALTAHLPPTDRVTRSPIQRLPDAADLLRRLLPESANLIDEIVQAIGPDHRPITAISHGDFHEAQLLVSGGRLRGVLDIDTHGRGRPGDDPATMLGHLSVLEHSSPQPGRVAAYRKALHQRWDGLVDPADLRLRSAAVIAGLATGPFRVQLPDWPAHTRARLELAARWAAGAHRIDESPLTTISSGAHPGPAS